LLLKVKPETATRAQAKKIKFKIWNNMGIGTKGCSLSKSGKNQAKPGKLSKAGDNA
jgi:hypothetical protein